MTIGNKRWSCPALALLLIAGVWSWTAGAAPASNWGIGELMQSLAQVKSANGTFVERKYLSILNAPLELSGTLSYSAPGHLEKHTLAPKPESLVLDRDQLTLEDKVRKQRRTLVLQDYPVLWALVESIRSTLAGDRQTLNRFYRVELEGDELEWRLSLKPRETRMQALVNEIRIGGSSQSVRTIEIFEAGGDRSVMTVTEDNR